MTETVGFSSTIVQTGLALALAVYKKLPSIESQKVTVDREYVVAQNAQSQEI